VVAVRKRVDKLAALRKAKWAAPPAALAVRWADLLKAKWVAWLPLVVAWVAPPVDKWAA
jgi:hypothetical protein